MSLALLGSFLASTLMAVLRLRSIRTYCFSLETRTLTERHHRDSQNIQLGTHFPTNGATKGLPQGDPHPVHFPSGHHGTDPRCADVTHQASLHVGALDLHRHVPTRPERGTVHLPDHRWTQNHGPKSRRSKMIRTSSKKPFEKKNWVGWTHYHI